MDNSQNKENFNLDKPKKKNKKYFFLFLLSFLIISFLSYFIIKRMNYEEDNLEVNFENKIDNELIIQNEKEKADSIKNIIKNDRNHTRTKDSLDFIGFDENTAFASNNTYKGRRINIAITGVDSRLGSNFKHADANHILSILLDSGKIEIISVPRDTYVECGYEDSTGLNKLTVARAALSQRGYLREFAKIAEVGKIDYYIEFGFSQAIGIIDWLGYKDKTATLQVLRSRTGLGGDDYQRCYNQAQFIGQNIVKNFDKLNGMLGTFLVPSLLLIVDSDLTSEVSFSIMDKLKAKGFGDLDDISVKIKPNMYNKFKVYDFTDETTLDNLKKKIESYNKSKIPDTNKSNNETIQNRLNNRLYNLIQSSTKDTAKNPTKVIQNLNVIFNQKAWMQVIDSNKRISYRNKIAELLIVSYKKKNSLVEVEKIKNYIELEDKLNNNKVK